MIKVEFVSNDRALAMVELEGVPAEGDEVEINNVVYILDKRIPRYWVIDKGYYNETGNGGREPSASVTITLQPKYDRWKNRETGEIVEVMRVGDGITESTNGVIFRYPDKSGKQLFIGRDWSEKFLALYEPVEQISNEPRRQDITNNPLAPSVNDNKPT